MRLPFDRRAMRAALLAMLVVGVSAVAALVWVGTRVSELLEREVSIAVSQEAALLDAIDRDGGREALQQALRARLRLASDHQRMALLDRAGATVAGNVELPGGSRTAPDGPLRIELGDGRVLIGALATLSDGSRLLVGETEEGRATVRRSILAAALLALVVIGLIGAFVAMRFNDYIIDRIETLASTARQIMRGQLTARAPESAHVDAFGELSRTMNDMLDQSEALVTGMRTITDSLAHDLRTPLTRMRNAIAEARAAREPAERERLLEEAEAAAARALHAFTALIDLARAESGLSRDAMEQIDLGSLASDVAELFGPMLEEAQQRLDLQPRSLVVLAHRQILMQALGNLLENAHKYAPPGSTIRLCVDVEAGAPVITIEDQGPGIPLALREQAVARFERCETAGDRPGTGLGLAIAAAAARLHGGRLQLEDAAPGLRARLFLNNL